MLKVGELMLVLSGLRPADISSKEKNTKDAEVLVHTNIILAKPNPETTLLIFWPLNCIFYDLRSENNFTVHIN
jgi:hypothetical protein